MQEAKLTHKQILTIATFAFLVIVVILLIITLQAIFHKNPYGNEIKIDNFKEYYEDVPSDRQDVVFNSLYNIVVTNSTPESEIPESGALIRPDSAKSSYDESVQSYYGSFIVDIAEIQQSYRVQFGWVDKDSPNGLSGDSTLITCVDKSEVIYEDFNCTDSLIHEEEEAIALYTLFPIMADLPIKVEYYVNGYGAYIHYEIGSDLTYEGNEEYSFAVIIDDYTGGNYEAAIQKITELGYDYNDYEIIYRVYDDQPAQAF